MKKFMPFILVLVVLLVGAGVAYFVLFYEAPVVYTNFSPGDVFVTNVNESDRLFRTGVVLVLDTEDSKILDQMEKNKPLIRDTIIFILRKYSETDLKDASSHDKIRTEIMTAINKRLEFEHVVEVLFNDFVMQ